MEPGQDLVISWDAFGNENSLDIEIDFERIAAIDYHSLRNNTLEEDKEAVMVNTALP